MKKTSTPYLEDILESIFRIEEYIEKINQNKKAFESNIEKQDSVLRRLELIGEATKRLEKKFRNKHAEIPWRKMAGMRDVLIHEYDQIDLDLVWEVIVTDLPILKKSVQNLLNKIIN